MRTRRSLPDVTVYSASNVAGESGRQAAADVLYLDALICDDSFRHGRDYDKLFHVIQLCVVDAVGACRGVPAAARSVVAEALSGVTVEV